MSSLFSSTIDGMDEHVSYDPQYFQPLFDAEDRHFWFVTRNRILKNVLTKLDEALPAGYRAAELGCGDGNTLRVMESTCTRGRLIGSDLFYAGLQLAKQRVASSLVQADVAALPFNHTFMLVGLFDVLEHIMDDQDMLENVGEIMSKDGFLVLTVPAEPALWSYFDEASRHARRYTRESLSQVLQSAGFEILSLTAFMSLTYPFVWLRRKSHRKTSSVIEDVEDDANTRAMQELQVPALLNWGLIQLLRIESTWLKWGGKFLKGSSLLVVARRSTDADSVS